MVEKSKITPPPLVQTSLAQVVCIMTLISSFFSNNKYPEHGLHIEGEKDTYKYRIQIGRPKKTLFSASLIPFGPAQGLTMNEDMLEEIADLKEMLSQSLQLLELELETVQISELRDDSNTEELISSFSSHEWNGA